MAIEDWLPVPGAPGLYQRADDETEVAEPKAESPNVQRMRTRMRAIMNEAEERRREQR
jgi:hypothetical protein